MTAEKLVQTTGRSIATLIFISLHTLACLAFVCIATARELQVDAYSFDDAAVITLNLDYRRLMLYVGFAFVDCISGLLTGLLMLLKPKDEQFSRLVKIWIFLAVIVVVTTFVLLSLMDTPILERSVVLLITIVLYFCVYWAIVSEEEEDSDEAALSIVSVGQEKELKTKSVDTFNTA